MRNIAISAAILIALASGAGAQSIDLENCANQRLEAGATIQFCQKALQDRKLPPRTRAQVLATLGNALASQNRHRDAIVNYRLARGTDPTLMPAYTNSGRSNEALGDDDAALADYAAAIAADPGWVDAWASRGALHLRRNQPGEALPDLNRALELAPGETRIRYNRGIAHLGLGNAEPAERDFSAVIETAPGDAGAFLNRGRAKALLQRPDARADMDKALQLSPEWGYAWYIRGRHLESSGAIEEANADYLRAFQLGYSNTWLLQRVQQLSN